MSAELTLVQRKPGYSKPLRVLTYTFLTATFLDPNIGPDNGIANGTDSIDWRANAEQVFGCMLTAVGALPDAVELPNGDYLAQGSPQCAKAADATITHST